MMLVGRPRADVLERKKTLSFHLVVFTAISVLSLLHPFLPSIIYRGEILVCFSWEEKTLSEQPEKA